MESSTHTKPGFWFGLSALLIFVVPQAGIDLYLPSMPPMQLILHASQAATQLTFTVYMFAMGIMQLVYGPCSDRFGRKPTLLIALGIFILGSIMATVAQNIEMVLAGRLIQGLGMGGGFTIASAILGDAYKGQRLARITNLSSIIYSSSPILAPVFGGFFQVWFGWRANFAAMGIFSIVVLLMTIAFIFESNHMKNRDATRPRYLLKNYWHILLNLRFVTLVLCMTFSYGLTVLFNVVGPFLMQNILHMQPDTYGLILLILGIAYLAGNVFSGILLKVVPGNYLVTFGLATMLIFSLALLLSGLLGWFTITSITLWMALIIFGTGNIFPNCFAVVLTLFPEKLGAATALMGAFGLIITAALSAFIALLTIDSPVKLAFLCLILTALCVIFFVIAVLTHKAHTQAS